MNQKYPLALLVVLVIIVGMLAGALLYVFASPLLVSYRIPSSGRVKTVGVEVFWDLSATEPVTAIDWELVEPGQSYTKTVYVKNTGNNNGTISLSTENWNPPETSTYITLSWDYDGTDLTPDEVREVNLTLNVSSATTGIEDFTFDTFISILS